MRWRMSFLPQPYLECCMALFLRFWLFSLLLSLLLPSSSAGSFLPA